MKKLITGICAILCCLFLIACSDGTTTMDGGRDTDGRAGETSNSVQQPTSGENGEGAQGAAENITGGAKNAVDNTRNAARDVVDGAGQAVKDAADGVTRAVDDMTGKK